MPTAPDYSPAGELKIGQVGIANLRIRTLDVARLADEMRERVTRAPQLFGRAPIVVDFGALPATPSVEQARDLIAALRATGVLPVALAYGTRENEALAVALELPLLAKFRARYEQEDAAASAAAAPAPPAETAAAPAAVESAAARIGLVHPGTVRSGQQLYARQRDLTVVGGVSTGAEVLADGSIHIYGPLRGRALAGAQGDATACIFCREFHAELVAIAGNYRVMEDLPSDLLGKPVRIRLKDDTIDITALD